MGDGGHMRRHVYTAQLRWTGNLGSGTAGYEAYSRAHVIAVAGKPELAGSSDTAFRGEADRHNPEDLFVASLAACHMLYYLSLCARRGITVLAYEDAARGTLRLHDGTGEFEEVVLAPVVTLAAGADERAAVALHDVAHEHCFIARSCRIPIRHQPTTRIAAADAMVTS